MVTIIWIKDCFLNSSLTPSEGPSHLQQGGPHPFVCSYLLSLYVNIHLRVLAKFSLFSQFTFLFLFLSSFMYTNLDATERERELFREKSSFTSFYCFSFFFTSKCDFFFDILFSFILRNILSCDLCPSLRLCTRFLENLLMQV